MISRSLKFVLTGTSFNYFRIHTLILTRWVYFRITVISLDTERSSRRLWYLLKYDELMRDAGYLSFFFDEITKSANESSAGYPIPGRPRKDLGGTTGNKDLPCKALSLYARFEIFCALTALLSR